MSPQHVPATCPGNMSRQHVPATWPGNMARQHVPATCPGNMSRQHVPATCPRNMSRQHVPATCPGNMSRQHVPATCPGNMSRQHVPATCPGNMSLVCADLYSAVFDMLLPLGQCWEERDWHCVTAWHFACWVKTGLTSFSSQNTCRVFPYSSKLGFSFSLGKVQCNRFQFHVVFYRLYRSDKFLSNMWQLCDIFLITFWWLPLQLANQNATTVGGRVVKLLVGFRQFSTPPLTGTCICLANCNGSHQKVAKNMSKKLSENNQKHCPTEVATVGRAAHCKLVKRNNCKKYMSQK